VLVTNARGDTLCQASTGSGGGGGGSHGGGSSEAVGAAALPSIYRMFSMTKPLVAVCLLRFWERGALDSIGGIDADLGRILPEWRRELLSVWRGGCDGGGGNGSITSTTSTSTSTNNNTDAASTASCHRVVPAVRAITLRHLLTHTSGLTYGDTTHPVDTAHAAAGMLYPRYGGRDLARYVADLARVPLRFQPGGGWHYGASTDVLGRVLEVLAGPGASLDEVLRREVLGPLGMADSGFWLAGGAAAQRRLVPLFEVSDSRGSSLSQGSSQSSRNSSNSSSSSSSSGGGGGGGDGVRYRLANAANHFPTSTAPRLLSGGAGLLSTLPDYAKFARTLLANGTLWSSAETETTGRPPRAIATLLRPETVALMASNHLPGGVDIAAMCQRSSSAAAGAPPGGESSVGGDNGGGGGDGCAGFSEAATKDVGFGLGVSVQLRDEVQPAAATCPAAGCAAAATAGDFGWGGWASTWMQVSPRRGLALLLVAQLLPSDAYPLRDEFRQLVNRHI
jgi:CubicO group peptidase (beta-lactamase class C family)